MPYVKQIPVFLSSPGDVGDERNRALAVIDRLNAEPDFQDRIVLSAVAWDRPGTEMPMEAGLSPRRRSIRATQTVGLHDRGGDPLVAAGDAAAAWMTRNSPKS